jgi:LmbE family N-acetylglucosaminyl deacetylase
VVISPHPDDAVFSLGAAIDHAVQRGACVEVLTVFAGDVSSDQRAGLWDEAAGFLLAGEAAGARRLEDENACRALGAHPIWLNFGDEQYPPGGDSEEILEAITRHTHGADLVLVPGFPLEHRDHRFLAGLLTTRDLGAAAVAVYAEQPYAYLTGDSPQEDGWHALVVPASSTLAKNDACAAYRSQLPLLPDGLLHEIAEFELQWGGEIIRPVGGTPGGFSRVARYAWPLQPTAR